MAIMAQFLAGLLFGAGLIVSGMVNPAKVQGFLDVAGHWDRLVLRSWTTKGVLVLQAASIQSWRAFLPT